MGVLRWVRDISNLLRVVFEIGPVFVHGQHFRAAGDVVEVDRHMNSDIDTSVDAVTGAPPVFVVMANYLECVLAGVAPSDHRVSAKRNRVVHCFYEIDGRQNSMYFRNAFALIFPK